MIIPPPPAVRPYLDDFSEGTVDQLGRYAHKLISQNRKINLISRRDEDHIWEHHILHSLSILKTGCIVKGMQVLDVGTGGGLPGIPLAICCPDVHFTLADSIGKKMRAVAEMTAELGLDHVTPVHSRVESFPAASFDVIVSRAVAPALRIHNWTKKLLRSPATHHSNFNGWLLLKGGERDVLEQEVNQLPASVHWQLMPVSAWYEEEFYDTKYVVKMWQR